MNLVCKLLDFAGFFCEDMLLSGLFRFFSSRKTAETLFLSIAALLIPPAVLPGNEFFAYLAYACLSALGINIIFCLFRNVGKQPFYIFLLHIGMVIILVGGLASSYRFVATANIYEGDTEGNFYIWTEKKDKALDFQVKIKQMHHSFHAEPLKIGILKEGEKQDLIVTYVGSSFELADFRVEALFLDSRHDEVHLLVLDRSGQALGIASTAGNGDIGADFPYSFKLVAYGVRQLKKSWLDLAIIKNGHLVAEGESTVNQPFQWKSYRIFYTRSAWDEHGLPYAGIQITRDPGTWLVYLGFAIFLAGLCLLFLRRMKSA